MQILERIASLKDFLQNKQKYINMVVIQPYIYKKYINTVMQSMTKGSEELIAQSGQAAWV